MEPETEPEPEGIVTLAGAGAKAPVGAGTGAGAGPWSCAGDDRKVLLFTGVCFWLVDSPEWTQSGIDQTATTFIIKEHGGTILKVNRPLALVILPLPALPAVNPKARGSQRRKLRAGRDMFNAHTNIRGIFEYQQVVSVRWIQLCAQNGKYEDLDMSWNDPASQITASAVEIAGMDVEQRVSLMMGKRPEKTRWKGSGQLEIPEEDRGRADFIEMCMVEFWVSGQDERQTDCQGRDARQPKLTLNAMYEYCDAKSQNRWTKPSKTKTFYQRYLPALEQRLPPAAWSVLRSKKRARLCGIRTGPFQRMPLISDIENALPDAFKVGAFRDASEVVNQYGAEATACPESDRSSPTAESPTPIPSEASCLVDDDKAWTRGSVMADTIRQLDDLAKAMQCRSSLGAFPFPTGPGFDETFLQEFVRGLTRRSHDLKHRDVHRPVRMVKDFTANSEFLGLSVHVLTVSRPVTATLACDRWVGVLLWDHKDRSGTAAGTTGWGDQTLDPETTAMLRQIFMILTKAEWMGKVPGLIHVTLEPDRLLWYLDHRCRCERDNGPDRFLGGSGPGPGRGFSPSLAEGCGTRYKTDDISSAAEVSSIADVIQIMASG